MRNEVFPQLIPTKPLESAASGVIELLKEFLF